MKVSKSVFVGLALAGGLGWGTAYATPVLCEDTGVNHMYVDDAEVSACLDAGVGNLTGNPANDSFLVGLGASYELASKSDSTNPFSLSFDQNTSTGTWMFDAAFWDSYSAGAIGFKFGTGNEPDEWFVYSLVDGISSGDWEFVNVFEKGGGLSHVNLYGVAGDNRVPAPSSIALLALGLFGLALAGRLRGARV